MIYLWFCTVSNKNLFNFFLAYCPPSVHLSFDTTRPGDIIPDESGNHNNAKLANGAMVVNEQGRCDSAVSPMGKCGKGPIFPYKVISKPDISFSAELIFPYEASSQLK